MAAVSSAYNDNCGVAGGNSAVTTFKIGSALAAVAIAAALPMKNRRRESSGIKFLQYLAHLVAVDLTECTVVAGPEIHARGFSEDDSIFDEILLELRRVVEGSVKAGITDPYELQQLVRRTLGRWVSAKLRRKPMIVPVVVEA